MSARIDLIDDFLIQAGWGRAQSLPMAGDLSSRKYHRLRDQDGNTAVLMDASPDLDSSTPAFVEMTKWLLSSRLSAPRIMAADVENGLLLLEDLGERVVSDVIAHEPDIRRNIYEITLDLLVLIRSRENTALSCPDAKTLVDMTTLADEHYPGIETSRLSGFRQLLETVLKDLLGDGTTVSLRDFHTDNLVWLPERPGLARLGLLDYQDAFLTHPAYDLVSLLTDARSDIEPEFRSEMITLYTDRTGDDPDRFGLAFAALSAQRNMRILGIFARAARKLGRTEHLGRLPRVYGYLKEALGHPVFKDVTEDVLAAIPAPTARMIESFS